MYPEMAIVIEPSFRAREAENAWLLIVRVDEMSRCLTEFLSRSELMNSAWLLGAASDADRTWPNGIL